MRAKTENASCSPLLQRPPEEGLRAHSCLTHVRTTSQIQRCWKFRIHFNKRHRDPARSMSEFKKTRDAPGLSLAGIDRKRLIRAAPWMCNVISASSDRAFRRNIDNV